ncbi:MAG: DNA mismatch repair protein MutS [Acidobacteriota bacterium]
MDSLTPMMRQYHQIKKEHPDVLLFFRLGDFYEMFFEDAVVGSRELGITLTSRNTDRAGKPIPMCGVPHHAVNGYLGRLIKKGFRVAICEQVEDPRQAKGIVRREVTRIVTPGTAIEDSVLDSRENNYIAAVLELEGVIGAAFLDVSTGEFWACEQAGEGGRDQVSQALMFFRPREVVVPEGDRAKLGRWLEADPSLTFLLTPEADWVFNADYAQRLLLEHFKVATLEGFGINGQPAATGAAGALLNYVRQTQKSDLGHILSLRLFDNSAYLKLDDATIRNLELVRTHDGNRAGSLLSVLDSSKTGMGARLLRSWLLRPILDLEEIGRRLDAVEELQLSAARLDRVGKVLAEIHDVERLLSRVTLQTANGRDLLALKDSLKALPELEAQLAGCSSFLLKQPIDLLETVVELLDRSIDPDCPIAISDGGVIRTSFDRELDGLRAIAGSGKSYIAGLESQERQRTGIPSLKVKYNKVFGYFIEVTKAHLHAVPAHYMRKQTLVGAERFVTPELKEYEDKVLGAEERILELEKELFLRVRAEVAAEAPRIQAVAQQVARIDALLSLAEAARRGRYVRPTLDLTADLVIRGGRHPVVELQGGDPFVPNDLSCNNTTDQVLILTGPNMGGKSTYLRQNALIVIMAQMGSFVPADEARVGLVDRVFTRVGASDNLARGRSTFMVEMIETANILNTTTPRSLILLDEVGRGTATFDGLSLAWSIAEYLVQQPERRARTLFATHYQELTRLDRLYAGVKNYCVTVRRSGHQIIFFHKVMAGVANKSYGIEVARLAGIPQPVIERAREILTRLEKKDMDLSGSRRSTGEVLEELQKKLF